MYLFVLMAASLIGLVCAEGIFMATNSKTKAIVSFFVFTGITGIAIIS